MKRFKTFRALAEEMGIKPIKPHKTKRALPKPIPQALSRRQFTPQEELALRRELSVKFNR